MVDLYLSHCDAVGLFGPFWNLFLFPFGVETDRVMKKYEKRVTQEVPYGTSAVSPSPVFRDGCRKTLSCLRDRTSAHKSAPKNGSQKGQPPAVTKGCLMEVRGAHYPLTWGSNTTPL